MKESFVNKELITTHKALQNWISNFKLLISSIQTISSRLFVSLLFLHIIIKLLVYRFYSSIFITLLRKIEKKTRRVSVRKKKRKTNSIAINGNGCWFFILPFSFSFFFCDIKGENENGKEMKRNTLSR